MLFLAALSYNGVDKADNLLVHFVCLKNSIGHLLLRDLIGTGLDHDHLFPGRCNSQSHVGNLLLICCGVDDKLSVHKTYLCGCAWSGKGDIGNTGRNGGTQHSGQFRAAVRINGHYDIIQRNIIAVILWEQRAHGAVDHTACKDSVLRCLSLSLVKSSRDLSYGI